MNPTILDDHSTHEDSVQELLVDSITSLDGNGAAELARMVGLEGPGGFAKTGWAWAMRPYPDTPTPRARCRPASACRRLLPSRTSALGGG
jgi:hypothetical protein